MTVELAYEIDGPDDAPVVVLLNSVGTSGAMWNWQIGSLADQFRVVRIDARGHGRSPVSSDKAITIAELGNDVLAVLDRLELGRVHLAGLSLGGMTAMWLAIHHPERIRRLALLCTSACPGKPQAWHGRAATVRADGMNAIARAVVGPWVTPELAAHDPQLVEFLQGLLTSTDAESYAQCCEVLARLDLRADLNRITAPTLVIGADRDDAMPIAHSEVIASIIVGSRLVVVGPAAHVATVEVPEVITQLLLEHFGPTATLASGFRTRREVLGDEHVDATIARTTPFTADFQEFITRYAWGDVWSRPGLTHRDRSIATLATLVTLGAEHELAMHIRAAVRNGLAHADIAEVLLHTALYAGLPRANRAFAIAQKTLDELAATEED